MAKRDSRLVARARDVVVELGLVREDHQGDDVAAGLWIRDGIDAFTEGLDPISADIVRAGGLFAYARQTGMIPAADA